MKPPLFTRGYVTVCLATLLSSAAQYSVITAIPVLLRQLDLPDGFVGGFVGLFALGALATRFPIGVAIDRLGARRFGAGGTALVAISCILYALMTGISINVPLVATVPLLLPIAGLVHSVGFGIYGTSANAFVAYIVPAERRGEAVAYFGVLMNVAMSIGAGVSLLIVGAWGFDALLGLAATLAVVAALLWSTLSDVRHDTAHDGPASKFGVETKVLIPALANTALAAGNGAALAFVPLLGLERGIANPGIYFTAVALTSILSRLVMGRVADVWGRFVSIVPGMLVAAVGYGLVSQASSVEMLGLAGIVVGMGTASAVPALQALAIDMAGPNRRGAAMATFWAMVDLGVSIGSIAAGQMAPIVGYGGVFAAMSAAPLIGLAGISYLARFSQRGGTPKAVPQVHRKEP